MSAARPTASRAAGLGRRRLLGGLLGLPVLAGGGLTGCGDAPTARVDDGPVELSVFWWGGTKRAQATEQALRLYSQRNPRVSFRVTWQSLSGYYDRVATQAVGGNVPDLFQIDDTVLTEYARRQIVLDLSRHVADRRLDLSGLPAGLARYGQVEGRTMAVAAGQSLPVLVWNADLLSRLEVPAPTGGMPWPDYIAWAARVTRAAGGRLAGTVDPSGDYRAFWLWLRSRGGELYQDRQLGFGSGELLDWFELWERARSDRATPGAALADQADTADPSRQGVVRGHTAASFSWSHQFPDLQRYTDDRLSVTAFPGPAAAQWPRASMYWAGFRGTRHPDLVVDVIDFLVNDVAAGRILGQERGLNPSQAVRAAVRGTLTEPGRKQVAALAEGLSGFLGPAPEPPAKGHAAVRRLLVAAAESIRSGDAGARSATSKFMAQANAALAG
ncbi:ABC transporter substrate-binding protein [Micromonospora mirobrigensis]|uniref:Carbohydrate ABC transporter substrate-binding protein, CUT1 family (TC 3.A.1.1.-) n=1 Tax=Micromonospora mirobrigensis TaxID=262898 RepID=A0A1C4XUY2_9ACTN|nr:ABC transporter substrate-binding protein [Micromonospora mirobrigensis]SCF12260.1 carbohydrate ABC transporter substrate-binding protein, CUT1 family (TC 3.A.1.1.-) [Micromonospora mirobrigensis]